MNKIIVHEQLTAQLTGPFKTIIWTIFCKDCCELYITFIFSPVPGTKILAANSKKNLSRAMFGCWQNPVGSKLMSSSITTAEFQDYIAAQYINQTVLHDVLKYVCKDGPMWSIPMVSCRKNAVESSQIRFIDLWHSFWAKVNAVTYQCL